MEKKVDAFGIRYAMRMRLRSMKFIKKNMPKKKRQLPQISIVCRFDLTAYNLKTKQKKTEEE